MEKFEKIYDYEDRLVRFAGESALFAEKLPDTYTAVYYRNQLIRSSGSPVLNYGEAQATVTDKDFIHKMSISVKELKESRVGCTISPKKFPLFSIFCHSFFFQN